MMTNMGNMFLFINEKYIYGFQIVVDAAVLSES